MVYLLAIIAGLAGFLFGYDEGVIAGALPLIKQSFHISNVMSGIVGGILPFGALFGSLILGIIIASKLSRRLGRRTYVFSAGILFIFGALFAAISTDAMMLIIARFFVGLAIGIAAIATPLYIAECSPAKLRGALVTVYQLAITVGILCAYLIDYFLLEHLAWRWMFAGGLIPAMILAIGVLLLPESPRWLVNNNYIDAARNVLKKLRNTTQVEDEIQDIQQAIKEEAGHGKWRDLFSANVLPVLVLGMGLFFLQQVSGINIVIYYAPQIFSQLGFGKLTIQFLATVGIGVMNVLMTIVAFWLIDRIGRRILLLVGFAGTALSLGLISIAFFINIAHLNWIAFIGLLAYIASFAISLGPVPFVAMSEIFPLNVRGPGMSMSSISNWGFNSIIVFTFPPMIAAMGIGWVFVFYACWCVFGFIATLIYMPETKGTSLEKIEHNIHTGKTLRNLGANNNI